MEVVPKELNGFKEVKEKRKNNKWLIIILVALAIAIIGLIVGIIVVNLTKNNDGETSEDFIVVRDEEIVCNGVNIEKDDYAALSKCIRESDDNSGDNNDGNEIENEADVFERYDEAINQLKEQGNLEGAAEMVVEKLNHAYLYMEDCGLAIEMIEAENFDDYPQELWSYINSMAWSLWTECKDEV